MVGSHTVFDDIKRTWAGISRKKDPALVSAETNIRKEKYFHQEEDGYKEKSYYEKKSGYKEKSSH